MTPAASEACPRCLGTGFEVREGEDGIQRARPCGCRDQEREGRLLTAARIPRRYEHCSFDNFEVHDPSQGVAGQIARRFVKDHPAGEGGLLFVGPCGTGKTHLAVSILKALVHERGIRCMFYDFQDLLKEIQSSYSPVNRTSEMSILMPVFTAEVLVLDDLGAQKPTAWVRDTVGHIVNNRYNDRRTTLFTTNRHDGPQEERGGRPGTEATLLDQIGARLHSRIYEMCHVVRFQGEDYRKRFKHPGLRSRMKGPAGL
ncbi:MAG: ATP-binding protein [Acidobacteriota bacterium]